MLELLHDTHLRQCPATCSTDAKQALEAVKASSQCCAAAELLADGSYVVCSWGCRRSKPLASRTGCQSLCSSPAWRCRSSRRPSWSSSTMRAGKRTGDGSPSSAPTPLTT